MRALSLPEPLEQCWHVHLIGFVVAGQRVHDDVDAGAEGHLALILAAADEPAREPAKPKASRSEGAPDELIDEEAPPAPAPKKGGKPAKKSKEEVTLDELLLPGVPQR